MLRSWKNYWVGYVLWGWAKGWWVKLLLWDLRSGKEESCGGIFYFFLRIYCSVGREHLSGSMQYRPGKYQLDEKLLYPTNIKKNKAPGRGERLTSVKLMVQLGLAWGSSTISSWSCSKYNQHFSYYAHVHTIVLRARPLRSFLGDPYKTPLTKAALCASRGTPSSDVKKGKKRKKAAHKTFSTHI